ncbi:MAG: acyltransferase family protein [Candidatus Hydrothermarchaeales archaeon]
MESKKPERRHDVDWLRVLATFSIVFFHVMRFFDLDPWAVKNNATSEIVMPFIGFFVQWMMPIFFVISGAAIYFALGFRNPRQFIKARITRIIIPLITVGVFVLVPPQEYIQAITYKNIPRGFSKISFYTQYVKNIKLFIGEFPFLYLPVQHLWYLEYLFLFSLILLPLFIYLRKNTGMVSKLAGLTDRGWTIYLFALPVWLLMSILNPETPLGNVYWFGGWPLLAYPIFLILGFILFTDKRYEAAIEQQTKSAIKLAIISLIVALIAWMKYGEGGLQYGTLGYPVFMMLRAFNSWFFIIVFLGLGRKHLSYTSPFLRYFSEASLPIYMLHQTVIVVIGFFIQDWQIGILPKFIFLLIATCIGIMGIYEVLIRRINASRFLFGLKAKKG